MKIKKLSYIMVAILALTLTGCSNTSVTSSKLEEKDTSASANADIDASSTVYPLTIKHAFGETVIGSKPERVATISWGNQDVPLALGIIPVGVSKANYGVTDGSGLLPWTKYKFKELGV